MLRTLTALVAAVLLTLTTASVVQADKPDSLPDQASAKAALAAAKALFREGGNARAKDDSGRDATLVLRDLALSKSKLTGADRKAADAILARPTDGLTDPGGDGYTVASKRLCSVDVCVHWVESTSDAIPLADVDTDKIPDYAETALASLQEVHESYLAAGYRKPRPDGALGGDSKTDVYLAEVGDDQLYGYCTSDEDVPDGQWVAWAYCVLDNDYDTDQFPSNTPIENLQVTAAHEYFHAVQFGYDWAEDGWFMEATATWAEDELFDSVNDSVNYLEAGPLGRPRASLDLYEEFGAHQYGTWIFFRYLTERHTTSQAGMPTLVRDMWRRADSLGKDNYSLQAVRNELKSRNADWTTTFTRFAEAGRRARQVYDEGRSQRYPNSPLAFRRISLSPTRPATNWGELRMDHLSSATARFVPSRSMTNRRWKIRLQVDMASRSRGSAAIATVHYRRKAPATRILRLSRRGNGSTSVSFSRRSVKAVELTLVNTSTRTTCWQDEDWVFSCAGDPKDDNLRQKLRARAYR